jgi:hypothetical protein
MEKIHEIKNLVAERADISRRYLDYLLSGEKDARPGIAARLETVTTIHRSIWTFGTSQQRQSLFDNFVETYGKSWLAN